MEPGQTESAPRLGRPLVVGEGKRVKELEREVRRLRFRMGQMKKLIEEVEGPGGEEVV